MQYKRGHEPTKFGILRGLAKALKRAKHAQSIKEYLWCLQPDNCVDPICARMGVRGNENVIDGQVLCDYCHSRRMR